VISLNRVAQKFEKFEYSFVSNPKIRNSFVLKIGFDPGFSLCPHFISKLARALVSEMCDRKTYVAIVVIGQLLFFLSAIITFLPEGKGLRF